MEVFMRVSLRNWVLVMAVALAGCAMDAPLAERSKYMDEGAREQILHRTGNEVMGMVQNEHGPHCWQCGPSYSPFNPS